MLHPTLGIRKRHAQLFRNPSHLKLFLNLGSDIDSELWNEWDVARLSRAELQQLGIFLGITRGYSLPKSEIVTRILGTRQIWLSLGTPPVRFRIQTDSQTPKSFRALGCSISIANLARPWWIRTVSRITATKEKRVKYQPAARYRPRFLLRKA